MLLGFLVDFLILHLFVYCELKCRVRLENVTTENG